MLPVSAVIVDFDGTVCLHDVGMDLMETEIEGIGVLRNPIG